MNNLLVLPLEKQVRYNDLYLRLSITLIGAHFVVSFGEPENVFELMWMWDYYRSMLYSWGMAFSIMTMIRFITVRLDQRFSWQYKTAARLALQILFGVGALALIAFFLAGVYFAIHDINILHTDYLMYDFPVIVLMLFLVNCYYLLYYVLISWKNNLENISVGGEKEQEEGKTNVEDKLSQPTQYRQVVIVQVASKNIPIVVKDISYFFRQNDENFLHTKVGEDYLISESLDYYEQSLDPQQFFRANRKFLVAFNCCERFENIENDKLELFVIPTYKERIIISQKSAPAFRRWMNR